MCLLFTCTSYFQRLAIWLLSKGAVPLKKNDATLGKIVKCSESLWKLTYYATVEAFILAISYQEPWFRDSKQYFRGWPNQELTWVVHFLGLLLLLLLLFWLNCWINEPHFWTWYVISRLSCLCSFVYFTLIFKGQKNYVSATF